MSTVPKDLNQVTAGTQILRSTWQTIQAYIQLTKPKILIMLLITGFSAMVVAANGMPSWRLTVETLFGLALSAGAGAVLNMWYDRDIDQIMHRTAQRPLPSGLVSPRNALIFGLVLAGFSTVFLAFTVNLLTAALSFSGFLYYVVIYTMWLKRRTPQNIVIGGGAGSFPPLVGWAAVTGHLSWPAWLMFAVIFLWTPPHFWALALYKNEDYVRANIPMMPVVRGFRYTKIQMFLYTVILLLVSLIPTLMGTVSWVYTVPTILMGAIFCAASIRVLREPSGRVAWAKRMFFLSLMYVPVWFLVIVLGTPGIA